MHVSAGKSDLAGSFDIRLLFMSAGFEVRTINGSGDMYIKGEGMIQQ